MEAASARYAARDRWAETGRSAPSQLTRYIQTACSAENFEPNLALNLEIADLINAKKGTAPREAAFTIVNYVNHRNPAMALLALNLLDICVKNCGYPFHLQISTKEFLNELVRRFPERPPIRPTRVQSKILEAIEEWRSTICETSRYKEDLGFVRDMHRLLTYKGYMFPEVRTEDAAVLNPSEGLRSVEEMEEEEREAQSAKLQELIRRGTPEDLQEANRLMKVMAGFDTRSKTDHHAKAAEEVGKIQAKARLLEERLAAFKQGDKMEENDVFAELASSLTSAQPKIQKMCEQESEDHEAVAKLLEINDSIHRTVQRYELMKKGQLEEAKRIGSAPAKGSSSSSAQGVAKEELSLIDFGTETDANGTSASGTTGAETDLLGLSIEGLGDSFEQRGGGGIALGFGANSNVPGPALLSSLTEGSSAKAAAPAAGPSPYSPFAPFASSLVSHATPPPPSSAQASSAFRTSQTKSPVPQPDLFASLPSLASVPGPPHVRPLSSPLRSSDGDGDGDDEWSFSSALPAEAGSGLPKERRAVVSNTDLKIEFVATRAQGSNSIRLAFAFTNNTSHQITEVHYELAVTKGYELQLRPQTGRTLEPQQHRGVTQEVEVWHTGDRGVRVETTKLRWRVAYRVGGEAKAEMGDISEFGIA